MINTSRAEIDDLNSKSWRLASSSPARALELASEAEDYSSRVRYSAGEARAQLNAGWACVYLGRLDAALTHIYSARSFFEATGDSVHLSEALNALGVIAQRLSEYDLALEHLQLALSVAITTDEPERRVAALNNLGELHEIRGSIGDASRCFETACHLAEEFGFDAARAVVRCNQGRLALAEGDHARSRHYLDDALQEAVLQNDRATEIDALRYLGDLERVIHDSDTDGNESAEQFYLESIRIALDIMVPDAIVGGLVRLIQLLLDTDRLDEALIHAQEALEHVTTVGHLTLAGDPVRDLAGRLEQTGDLQGALLVMKSLEGLNRSLSLTAAGRRAQTLRHYHQLEQARVEAQKIQLRNRELQSEWEHVASENTMLHMLHQIGSELTASLDMGELSRRLYAHVNKTMPADVFGLARYNEPDKSLEFAHVVEQNQQLTPFSVPVESTTSFGSWVVRHGEEIFLSDANHEFAEYLSDRKQFSAGDSQSLIFLPLTIEERIIGVLTVQAYRKHAFRQEHVSFLRMLAPYLAIAMDNSEKMETITSLHRRANREKQALEVAYQQINHMANHDTLTGLPNRRLITELIAEHINLAQRRGVLFGLLYLDLDEFKPINDSNGHSVGDQVLIEIARRLESSVRQSDSVARLGGDEFLVVVRDIASEEALIRIAEKIRDAILEPIAFDEFEFSLSASIGVSVFPTHGQTFDKLVAVADEAMYRSKQSKNVAVTIGRL
jgi:diguanylate cyclase (GGDEF)-like protein